jgi:DNA-binding CsgD family transcriptional regulator
LEKETLDCFDATIELYDSTSHILEQIELIEDKTEQNNSLNNTEGEELSPRENAIVALVAKGHTNKEIADMLNISVHTVITHRKNISKKTGIKSISGLTMYAMLNKLI